MTDSCFVCAEKYNKSTRKLVTCKYCDYQSCSSCCQSYLLTINSPKCMNCNTLWGREFLQTILSKSFLDKKLKEHHKNYLFDIEKALLPATMPDVEKQKKITEINAEIKKLEIEYHELGKEWRKSFNTTLKSGSKNSGEYAISNNKKQILNPNVELSKKMKKILDKIHHFDNMIISIKRDEETSDFNNSVKMPKLITRCPTENCRAFLNSQFICSLCNVSVCELCHQIKTESHICKKDDIESVNALKQNTKPCPNCAVPIFKLDGCDQMWCVSCHTAFSWQTGNIETKIHNPHYFQWLNKNRKSNEIAAERNPLDFACGRELDYHFISDFNTLQHKIITSYKNHHGLHILQFYGKINDLIQKISHILHDTIPQYQENRQNKNKELRIKYLLNEINESIFKKNLFSNEKFTLRNKEILDILIMYVHVSTDIIYKIYDNAYGIIYRREAFNENYREELQQLTEYFSNNLDRICSIYNTKPPKNITSSIEYIKQNIL